MFCAIATTIERCKTEGVVDVFQVVKALRVQKPGAVPTVVSTTKHTLSPPSTHPSHTHTHTQSQYHAVFESVLVYLDSFETYGNFQDL